MTVPRTWVVQNTGQAGIHLKRLREARGWNVRSLEALSGVSRSTISDLERGVGNPTLEVLLRLQYVFRLDSIEALLGRPPSADMAGVPPGQPR